MLSQVVDLQERKQFIGNQIYPVIEAAVGGAYAGKITGMLLDEKAVEIDKLLTDQNYLSAKVFEAYQLIEITTTQQAQMMGQPMIQSQWVTRGLFAVKSSEMWWVIWVSSLFFTLIQS